MGTLQPLVSSFPGLAGALPVLPFPLFVNHVVVTAVKDVTVPANAKYVIISPDADCWISGGHGSAVVPSGDITDGTGSAFFQAGVMSPPFRVQPAQIFSIVAATGTSNVSLWYYSSLGAV